MPRGLIKKVGDNEIHEVFNGTNDVFVAIDKNGNELSFSGRIAFQSVVALEVTMKGISISAKKKLGSKKIGNTTQETE